MNATLDIARQYLSRGWKPVPIPLGSKAPVTKGWGKAKVTTANVEKHFNGGAQNIGVQFGEQSGGLADVDLDCIEAVKLAARLLPNTDAIFGRASKPASHYLFVTRATDAKASKQFRDSDRKMIVELRMGSGGKAAQTLFPGSVHPSGEALSWVKEGEPAEVPFAQLMAAVTRVAVGALLCRHWPSGDGHEAALRVGGFLARSGWEAVDVAGFVGTVAHAAGDQHHRDHERTARDAAESHARGGKVYGFPALQDFFGEKQAKLIAQWLNNEPEGTGPSIKCVAGEIPRMTDEAEAALIKAGVQIYVHGSQLVQPVIEECEAAHDRKTMVARLRPMTDVTMVEAMSATARWARKNERGFWVRTDPPVKIARTLQEREGRWHLPRVVGVITCPTLRPDGSLLAIPGYDPATKLLLVAPPSMPSIPEQPTKAEAEAALARLDALLDEFPFTDEASRSVGLSMLLTTVARGAMMCAPGHVVTAPEAGTGKSFMIDIASTIATGRWCPVVAAGRNEEETEKRLGALLIKGQPMVSIDNVNGHLGGDLLCQMITQPTVEVRVLGLSKTISVDNRMTLFANGNNIKLIGDLVRRVVRCSMDADMERPETRKFTGNPIDKVLADRGKYIADALTVVRAFIVAGRPGVSDLMPFLGFDGWNNTVRGALVWLGRADPTDSVKSAREEDPGRATLAQVVEAIAALNLGHGVTAGELAKEAEAIKTVNYGGIQEYERPELHDALIAAIGDRGRIGANALGKWLDRHAGRVVGGYKIVKEYDRKLKQNHWFVKEWRK